MNPNYKHDFSSASIKHQIEAEFYQLAGSKLSKNLTFGTIVTGPDHKRHVDNYNKYINNNTIRICETNLDVYMEIYKAYKDNKKVTTSYMSIELFGSLFVDCDLTCTSDLEVIQNTLLNQIKTQASLPSQTKAFIFSFGLRTHDVKPMESHLRPILGLLGASIVKINKKDSLIKMGQRECKWIKPVTINGTKGRIKEYKCYSYNAGGGPMLTCLLIYK